MPLSINHVALCAIAGILPLGFLPALPAATTLYGIVLAGWLLWLTRAPGCRLAAITLAAFAWGCLCATQILQQTSVLSQPRAIVRAHIVSIHHADSTRSRAVIKITQAGGARVFPPVYAAVSWQSLPERWCAGQRWKMMIKLRPQHSRLNEGGFDSQRWAVANHQPLVGRVIKAKVEDARCGLRQRLIDSAAGRFTDLSWPAILLALAFGESRGMPEELRLLLQQTGTAHLMAISGLHISLAALFGWLVARGGQFFLPLRLVSPVLPLAVSWLSAAGYVWISGVNFPAVRALLALSLWILLRMRGVHCGAWQVWLWCVALILVTDPLSVLSSSLWLSCLAVAALVFWFQWAPLPPRFQSGLRWAWLRWLHLQCGMTLLLLPLQWGLFHGVNPLSLPANLWAVPLVSFITTPLILAAICLGMLPAVSRLLWYLADQSLTLVFWPLAPLQQGWRELAETGILCSIGGWLAVIIWRFGWWHTYRLNIVVLAALLLAPRDRADRPRWRVDMLDVGHGLAVSVERDGKALLYDTGAGWQGGDIGKAEIVPYLAWRGLTPEGIFLSHSHQDHIGGLGTLKRLFPGVPVSSSYRSPGHLPCLRGQQWHWQGLRFSVLWPPGQVKKAGNDDSCVIKIEDGTFSILLTGDIEAPAERALLKTARARLRADILQVPHHGSKTSSTRAFLRAVRPTAALASAGRFSPWRLPAPAIRERYRREGVTWHDTARSGQVSIHFYDTHWMIKGYREQIMPRWYHQWFGVQADNE
ncbi:ComEC family protein [Enterobacteriales bacterium SAP-6]|uniref:ComEC family protein n=2 Tax=Acerihabitans arboris TaxID=2691583 RepID=A0A845SHR5_9GAMM|nr:ComEC family protein [Acerihabitans arboris]